jgi:hypothetical protein
MSSNLTYQIDYQPQLIEEAVLCAIIGHPRTKLFRQERDKIYELANIEERENAFQNLHQVWFNDLKLGDPLLQVLEVWPILVKSTYRCILTKAVDKKNESAELYVSPKKSGLNERESKTIIIQLTPELLCDSDKFLNFLRRELLHIVDMLDSNFGYKPDFPKAEDGPVYDGFLLERYKILWNMTVDSRLLHRGWVTQSVKEKHFVNFKRTFPLPEKESEKIFNYFFDGTSHTHDEFVSFSKNPEKFLKEVSLESKNKGRCSICHFPSFNLITNPSIDLPENLLIKIKEDNPDWKDTSPICLQCMDLYELRGVNSCLCI